MKQLLMGVGLLCLLAGCGDDEKRPCGSACDAQPSRAALQICSGKSGGARHGESKGVTWTDEIAFTEDEVVAGCERLCGFAARCTDEDEAACVAQCPSVAAQAAAQTCEQSLMTAMECLARNACAPAPEESLSDRVVRDPCELALHAVSCSILPESDGPTVLDRFQGADGQGVSRVAAVGEGNDPYACVRYLDGSQSATSLDIQCRRDDGTSWCCECNVDQSPVRAFAQNADYCPASDLERAVELCGWRY